MLMATSAWAQEWRGSGRLMGRVVDEQGKALEGVIVRASFPVVVGALLEAKTNKSGDWTVDDVGEGDWELTFEKDGYDPAKASAEVDESGRSTPLRTTLKKAFDPNAFIRDEGKKADALIEQKKYAAARAVYDGIIAKVPEVSAQMQPFLARTYFLEGKPDKSVEHLKAGLAKDPGNVQMKLLLVSMLLETGAIDEASQVLSTVDEANVSDAALWVNFGLSLLKKQKSAEALPYFDKAVARFPQSPEAYYYRALALVELVNAQKDPKDPERIARIGGIKADLTKFLQLAPTSPEVENVKKLLEQVEKLIQK
jgi:predicted Zn-dependent protease